MLRISVRVSWGVADKVLGCSVLPSGGMVDAGPQILCRMAGVSSGRIGRTSGAPRLSGAASISLPCDEFRLCLFCWVIDLWSDPWWRAVPVRTTCLWASSSVG